MRNWRDFLLATFLTTACVALPQFTATELSAHLVAMLGCFALIWRLAATTTDSESIDETLERLESIDRQIQKLTDSK